MNKQLLQQIIKTIPGMKAKPTVDGITTRLYRNDRTNSVSAYVAYRNQASGLGKQVKYTYNFTGHDFTVEQASEVLTLVNNLLHSLSVRFTSQYDANTRTDWADDELDSFWNNLYESGDAQIIKELQATTVTSLTEAQTAMEKLPMSIIDWDMNKVNLDELMNFKYRRTSMSIFGTQTQDRRISYAKLVELEVSGNTDIDLVTNIVLNRTMKQYNKGQINTIWVPLFIKNDFIAEIAYKEEINDLVKILKESDWAGISTELQEVINEFTFLKDTEVSERDNGDWARQTLTKVLGKLRRTITVLKSEPDMKVDQTLLTQLDEYIREHLGSILEDLQMVQDISDSLKLNAITQEQYSSMYKIPGNPLIKNIFWKKVTRAAAKPTSSFAKLQASMQ